MNIDVVHEIEQRLDGIGDLYHKLVLLVGPSGVGKTRALHAFATARNSSILNLGIDLSSALMELSERQRILSLPALAESLVGQVSGEAVAVDNIEVLFEPSLKQDALRVLQGLARNRAIVACWQGESDGDHLWHGIPGHPDYRRYSTETLLIVKMGAHRPPNEKEVQTHS